MSHPIQSIDVFTLLGVDGTAEEKAEFLTQLEEVVWDSITREHIEQQLDEQRIEQVEKLLDDESLSAEEKKAKLEQLLREMVPDFDQVLIDTTNELKLDLLQERIGGMLSRFENDQEAIEKLNQAQEQFDAKEYQACVEILNSLN